MKKIISSLMIMLVLMSCLVGCKDDSYAGLAVPENASQIYDLCRTDTTFTDGDAKEIADALANLDFKRIKKVKEYEGGTERKIVITDGNGLAFIIFMSNDKVIAVQGDGGQTVYIRPIKKETKDKKK